MCIKQAKEFTNWFVVVVVARFYFLLHRRPKMRRRLLDCKRWSVDGPLNLATSILIYCIWESLLFWFWFRGVACSIDAHQYAHTVISLIFSAARCYLIFYGFSLIILIRICWFVHNPRLIATSKTRSFVQNAKMESNKMETNEHKPRCIFHGFTK